MIKHALEEKWFVAYTYPQAEKKIHSRIQKLGIESFLPLRKVKRQWSDRIKILEIPLFPSYIFVKTRDRRLQEVQNINGISRFLYFENKYATIKEEEIELIRSIIKEDKPVTLLSNPNEYKAGQKAIIIDGSFKGFEGHLVHKDGKERFIITLENFDSGLLVSIPTSSIKIIENLASNKVL